MDVEVVPAALGGELMELEPHCGVHRGGVDQPAALGVQRVVALAVVDGALRAVQAEIK